jgi:hypothetical protein
MAWVLFVYHSGFLQRKVRPSKSSGKSAFLLVTFAVPVTCQFMASGLLFDEGRQQSTVYQFLYENNIQLTKD